MSKFRRRVFVIKSNPWRRGIKMKKKETLLIIKKLAHNSRKRKNWK